MNTKPNITSFKKGQTPWNKGVKGLQVAWNKGLKRGLDSRVIAPWEGKKRPNFPKTGPRPSVAGSNHYRWIKDRTLIVGRHNRDIHDPDIKQWRKSVFTRDSYKCKIANEKCDGRIEAHHILRWKDFPELRYEVNNGITLCHSHHPRKRIEEDSLSPYFKSLITTN